MNLYQACKQWVERPADQRFRTLQAAHAAAKGCADSAAEAEVYYKDLRVEPAADQMLVLGKTGTKAIATNYFFGQLAARAGAPANYLRTLPAELAAQCLNTSIVKRAPDDKGRMLVHVNGELVARCITGEQYERLWNHWVLEQLMALIEAGWRLPPARPAGVAGEETYTATAEDVVPGSSIQVGDLIAPAGVYVSDRDMFCFLVHPDRALVNPADPSHPLYRFAMFANSEVGDKAYWQMSGGLDHVCGNHILWNVAQVAEVRIRHVGQVAARAFRNLQVEMTKYADRPAGEEEALILRAQRYEIAAKKQDVVAAAIKWAAGQGLTVLNRPLLTSAYELAERTPRYGNPNTPWALTQGLSALSQDTIYQNRRAAVDIAAGKLLRMAF